MGAGAPSHTIFQLSAGSKAGVRARHTHREGAGAGRGRGRAGTGSGTLGFWRPTKKGKPISTGPSFHVASYPPYPRSPPSSIRKQEVYTRHPPTGPEFPLYAHFLYRPAPGSGCADSRPTVNQVPQAP